MKKIVSSIVCVVASVGCFAQDHALENSAQVVAAQAWMNTSLSPAQRADLVLQQMTLDEKILLVHGEGVAHEDNATPAHERMQLLGNGGVGLAIAPTRLSIPVIDMSDAAYGVRSSATNGRYSTALPSNLGSAASWDPQAACAYGKLIGTELRDQGFNMTLGGGTNLTREPRNGRTFEYMGEDPLLAGVMVGQRIKCEGEQHIISNIKHYAMNDQESGRTEVDATIPKGTDEPWKRLVGWQKVELAPGKSQTLTVSVDSLPIEVWDTTAHQFVMTPGAYRVMVGGSSNDAPLQGSFKR